MTVYPLVSITFAPGGTAIVPSAPTATTLFPSMTTTEFSSGVPP